MFTFCLTESRPPSRCAVAIQVLYSHLLVILDFISDHRPYHRVQNNRVHVTFVRYYFTHKDTTSVLYYQSRIHSLLKITTPFQNTKLCLSSSSTLPGIRNFACSDFKDYLLRGLATFYTLVIREDQGVRSIMYDIATCRKQHIEVMILKTWNHGILRLAGKHMFKSTWFLLRNRK